MGIIIRPLITEKMTTASDKLNRYGFIVDKKANKIQIRNAVKELYGVEIESVNTMNYSGKQKGRFTKGGYISGKANAFKKAMVTLAKGETIDFYSNI
ncbi:MAG: 50S ribosomal protein L23 [Lentimicrobiaceae bacterium]|jgi:large subunit ribosomal protein L23|nr:50S ribosomal protein L23 [Lentimicrobiaceae bacterium]